MNMRVVMIVLLSVASPVRALDPVPQDERVWSYTMQEVYERAKSYSDTSRKEYLASREPGLLEAVWRAAEFKGYVAATLDTTNNTILFNDCARRLPLNRITSRAADTIAVTPLDRSANADKAVIVAISIACNDRLWSPQ
jgi:hypothetical protein